MTEDWTREKLEKEYIGQMTAKTIEVNKCICGKNLVLDLSAVEEILRASKHITQGTCFCREKMGKCIEPMDGCLTVGPEATENVEIGAEKEISLEEALASLKRTHEAGLVHMAYTFEGDDHIGQICSCCSCCCHTLSAAVRFGYPDHAFTSEKIATQDSEACINCGKCVERCQFKARTMEENGLEYDESKCYGCGVCISTCPEEAIGLAPRKD